ncbi:pilus assembly protein [Myxococcaceae bacterium GXIMD 01537]
MRRDERGQALVIGAVAMLVTALVVLSSVSIGHGIYSKIKLQDAADAQSYSIAVKEARAYNFLAYTNRAMVVHYNAMLTMMAYVSHAFYLQETIGRIASVLKYIPYIGVIFNAVEQIIKAWMKIVDVLAQVLVPLLTALNVALWLAQEAVVYATVLDLFSGGGSTPINKTDPKATAGYSMSSGSAGGMSGALSNVLGINRTNMENFLHPIDDGLTSSQTLLTNMDPVGTGKRSKLMGNNKLSDPQMAKYRLLMGNIVNSARRKWTAVGDKPYLIGRKWKIKIPCLLTFEKGAEGEIKNFHEQYKSNLKDQLFAEDWVGLKIKPCFGPTIFEFRYKMQAKADRQKGAHTRSLYVKGGPNIPLGDVSGSKHHMFVGITPFFHGDPSYIRPFEYHFGYPCNLVITTKDMIGQRKVFELKNKFMEGQGTRANNGILDMTWGGVAEGDSMLSGLQFNERTGGMMASAVGRAIYHRPGEWKEEPNFFNPLWTARLAPMRTHWQSPTSNLLYPELAIANLAQSGINY